MFKLKHYTFLSKNKILNCYNFMFIRGVFIYSPEKKKDLKTYLKKKSNSWNSLVLFGYAS